jgi:hypothetical protein
MTGLSPRVIRVWFQNKRCKVRLSLLTYVMFRTLDTMGHIVNGIGTKNSYRYNSGYKFTLIFYCTQDKKIQNRMIEKQLQGEKVRPIFLILILGLFSPLHYFLVIIQYCSMYCTVLYTLLVL